MNTEREKKMKFWVYKSDKGYGFSTRLKSKRQDGSEIACYLPVGFKKGEEPAGNCQIDATDFFLTCYESKTGETRPKLFVMSWLGITKPEAIEAEYVEKDAPTWPDLWGDGNDLPF